MRPLTVPQGTPVGTRQAFGKWMRARDHRGCWGLWIESKKHDQARRAAHMKRCRKNRVSKFFPAGTPEVFKIRFWYFRNNVGRCSYAKWLAWQTGKGPHPLQFL